MGVNMIGYCIKNDKVIRKYLENRFQKLIHSVCHPTRDSIESPFTNVSVFDKEKLHNFIGPDNYQWYFPKNTQPIKDIWKQAPVSFEAWWYMSETTVYFMSMNFSL